MSRRQFILTDIEDRALAACDDMYLETHIARAVLESWYGRTIPYRELRRVYARLFALGLLRTYKRRDGRIRRSPMEGNRTQTLLVRATAYGCTYLSWPRRVGDNL